jgi:glycosyltransferase involved in cell wall biosynthesis
MMRVAYFVNQYPAVSHTFIRREIRALEALGVTVVRYALRKGANLADEQDKIESTRTRYILKAGAPAILAACVVALLRQPFAFLGVILESVRLGWRSDRGVLRHLVYVAEAALLARWCRQDEIQHVHAHFGTNSTTVAMFARRLSGVAYSFTAHGPEEFERAPFLSLERKLQDAAFAVCVSSFGRSQLMRWSPQDLWDKIVVVRCGVDSSFFESAALAPPDIARFVCVARLTIEKAHLVLLAATRRLRDAGTRCEVVLAGDGYMRPFIEEEIRRAGLEREVSLIGWVSGDRVREEMARARSLLLPSFCENLPVVIMEALALGRPVISTYVAGIPELVEHGSTGWLVPAGDEIALSQAMRECLEAPVERLARMGAAGRARVVDQHDSFKEAVKLKQLFEQHIQPAGQPNPGVPNRTDKERREVVRAEPVHTRDMIKL